MSVYEYVCVCVKTLQGGKREFENSDYPIGIILCTVTLVRPLF